MLALAPIQSTPSSVMHHTATSRPTSNSLRPSRTASPPRKPVQAHRTPSHTLSHSASTPSASSSSVTAPPIVTQRPPAAAPVVTPSSPIRPQTLDINSFPQADFLRLLSQLLQRIASLNDKIYHQSESQPSRTYSNGSDDPPPAYSMASSRPLYTSLTSASKGTVASPTSPLYFHARNVPTISIESYLLRILKYCPTTNEVFLSLLVYFDRMSVLAEAVTKEMESVGGDNGHGTPADGSTLPLVIDSYNIHRLIIAGVTVASKFFSDVFYTNSRYAKVGGLPTHELNKLELQFLLLNDFRLVVSAEELQRYAERLVDYSHSNTVSVEAVLYSSPSSELFQHQPEIPHSKQQDPTSPTSSSFQVSQNLGHDNLSPAAKVFYPYADSSAPPSTSSSSASSVAPTPTLQHITPSSSTSTITQGVYGYPSEYEGVFTQDHTVYGNGIPLVRETSWDSTSAASADNEESAESTSEAGETSVEEETDEEPTIRFIKNGFMSHLVDGVEREDGGEGRSTPQRRAASHPQIPSFSAYDRDEDNEKEVSSAMPASDDSPAASLKLVNGKWDRGSILPTSNGHAEYDDDEETTEDEVVYRGDTSRGPSRAGVGRSSGSMASRS